MHTHLNVFSSKTLYSTLFKFHINVLNIKEHERKETGDRNRGKKTDKQGGTERQRDKETVREGDRDKDRNLRLRLRKSQR